MCVRGCVSVFDGVSKGEMVVVVVVVCGERYMCDVCEMRRQSNAMASGRKNE